LISSKAKAAHYPKGRGLDFDAPRPLLYGSRAVLPLLFTLMP